MNIFKDRSKLYCFSPTAMLATFIIEFALALITFIRYKTSRKTRICILTLIGLGTFQLAEYRICLGVPGQEMLWAYIGFVAITLLPAFGLDFITLADRDRKIWVPCGYLLSATTIFSIFYFSLIKSAICGNNYVIFNMDPMPYTAFAVYYFGLLLLGLVLAFRDLHFARKERNQKKVRLYFWVLAGYFSFLLPTGVVYLFSSQSLSATTSIMCGFAVFFSFIIFFKIIPALIIVLSHHAHHRHIRNHK